jgi:phosphate-selective porin OprO/OprP
MTSKLFAALLSGTALMIAAPAFAQEAPATEEAGPSEPDSNDAAADAVIAQAAPVDDAEAKIQLLQEQVQALQESITQMQQAMVKTTPSWKGAPLYEDKEAGWSFKPRGRLMYDVGYVTNPDDDNILNRSFGFNTRFRRIRLGAEGTIPGGFGYKFEMDFANASVGFGDVIITYAPKDKPYGFTLGNHETLSSLEQITSSRYISFLERSAFNEAFINTRRLGLSAGLVNKSGDLRVNAGIFAAHSIDSSVDNDGWIAAGRAVYSPLLGSNQLHFGLNYQYRNFQSNNGATTNTGGAGLPSVNQQARYRARPFTQTTDVRFVDTANFAAKSDQIVGVEAAGIFKSLHVTGEAQYLKANAYNRGATFTDANDFFPTNSFLVPSGNPSFWGGYAEVGYFLTGEVRGYKNGLWDRTKVLKPFSKGGWGAVQLNGRVDYLDLDSNKLKNGVSNNFLTGGSAASINLTRGGKQLGLLGSVVWIPEDYLRMYFQYARANITGGPFSDDVDPGAGKPFDKRDFTVDTLTARASIDF